MKWRKINANFTADKISLITETGHIIDFKPNVNVYVDLDKKDKIPFFFVEFPFEYIETRVRDNTKPMTLNFIEKMTTKRTIEEYWKAREYDDHSP